MTKEVQDLILDWLKKIDNKVDDIGTRLAVMESKRFATTDQLTGLTHTMDAMIDAHSRECKSEPPRPSVLPSAPVKRFDGKIRIDVIQLAKIIGLIISMVAAAAGYDIAVN